MWEKRSEVQAFGIGGEVPTGSAPGSSRWQSWSGGARRYCSSWFASVACRPAKTWPAERRPNSDRAVRCKWAPRKYSQLTLVLDSVSAERSNASTIDLQGVRTGTVTADRPCDSFCRRFAAPMNNVPDRGG